jgi:rhamnogalacturonan endolyase
MTFRAPIPRTSTRCVAGVVFFAAMMAILPARAVQSPVTLETNATQVILANGFLTARVQIASATIASLTYCGREMVKGGIYFSMGGGDSFQLPSRSRLRVQTNTPEIVDIAFLCGGPDKPHKVDIEIHYVLKRDTPGIYSYAVLRHPRHYPATSIGEWRMVWKLDQDLLERICVDSMRNWVKPSAADLARAESTGIKEIVRLTSGSWAGRDTCKYMYSVAYDEVGCFGHASDRNRIGAWAVFGGYDYFNDGPGKQELSAADGVIHIHFGRNHYNGSSARIAAGETWSKVYGPWLLYLNTNTAGASALWADAQARARAESRAWPYAWVSGVPEYPPTSQRGSVIGRMEVRDILRPSLAAGTNTWVGLVPRDATHWQFDSKGYQYWTRARPDGSFYLPHVRPGTYTLSSYTTGAMGEYTYSNIVVRASQAAALGTLRWDVPRRGSVLAWEIGIPDRSAREFRHGTNYWEAYLWKKFPREFRNPLEYHVGRSDWSRDWNYAQSGYGSGRELVPWEWRIHFPLTNLPRTGDATLTLAWAAADRFTLRVFVNQGRSPVATLDPSAFGGGQGGNTLIRQGIRAKYGVNRVTIPVSMLRAGTNTITLVPRGLYGAFTHAMYDSLSLELPAP